MRLTLDSLLTYIQQADPDARLELTRWGQPVLVTTSLRVPALTVVNPEVKVMTPERRTALERDAS